MGCGSALGDLFILADTLIQSPQSLLRPAAPAYGPVGREPGAEDLRARLYRMHGEGQISEQVFDALRDLADRGRLRLADLAVHQAQALRDDRTRLSELSSQLKAKEVQLQAVRARGELASLTPSRED